MFGALTHNLIGGSQHLPKASQLEVFAGTSNRLGYTMHPREIVHLLGRGLMTASAQVTVTSFEVRVSNHGGAEEMSRVNSFIIYLILPQIIFKSS